MAAVQDVSHLPTTSKGCLEGGSGRFPSWPALPLSEANSRDICRLFCCGVGRGGGDQHQAAGLQASRGPQDPHLTRPPFLSPQRSALPSSLDGVLCSLLLRARVLETVVLLLLPVSSPPCSLAFVPITTSELPKTRPQLPWAPFGSGPHPSSWNKAPNPPGIPQPPPSVCFSTSRRINPSS